MADLAQFADSIVVAVVGVLVWFYLRGRFEQVDRRFGELRSEVREDIAALRGEVREDIAIVRGEVNALRGDLTNIALAVGARTRPEANQA